MEGKRPQQRPQLRRVAGPEGELHRAGTQQRPARRSQIVLGQQLVGRRQFAVVKEHCLGQVGIKCLVDGLRRDAQLLCQRAEEVAAEAGAGHAWDGRDGIARGRYLKEPPPELHRVGRRLDEPLRAVIEQLRQPARQLLRGLVADQLVDGRIEFEPRPAELRGEEVDEHLGPLQQVGLRRVHKLGARDAVPARHHQQVTGKHRAPSAARRPAPRWCRG